MARLGGWCFRRRWWVLGVWLVAVLGGVMAAGPLLNAISEGNSVRKKVESIEAYDLISTAEDSSGQVVALVDAVDPAAPDVRTAVDAAAARLRGVEHVRKVDATAVSADRRALLVVATLEKVDKPTRNTAVAGSRPSSSGSPRRASTRPTWRGSKDRRGSTSARSARPRSRCRSPPAWSPPSMIDAARVAAVLLAAGRSTRFGAADKLRASIDGKPMARRAAETLEGFGFGELIVVTTPALADLFPAGGGDQRRARRRAGPLDGTQAVRLKSPWPFQTTT